jgi:hypothetical protein
MWYDIDETGYYTTKSDRYINRYRIETTPTQDQQMKEYADQHYNDPYSLTVDRDHCGDLVTNTLQSGNVPTGPEPFMNQPNAAFKNIVEANEGK